MKHYRVSFEVLAESVAQAERIVTEGVILMGTAALTGDDIEIEEVSA
jgi:hypothetical protein